MLVARAFILHISPRALLAVGAIALCVAYSIIAAAAVTGLDQSTASLRVADQDRGWIVLGPDHQPFPAAQAPAGSTLLYRFTLDGWPLATLEPWPFPEDPDRTNETDGPLNGTMVVGPYTNASFRHPPWYDDLEIVRAAVPFLPQDAIGLPPARFVELIGNATDPVAAYIEGADPPPVLLDVIPWQGVTTFFEAGAAEVVDGLVFVVLAMGLVVALLSSGFVRLEVLARQGDLDTLEALAGRRATERAIALRAGALVVAGTLLATGVGLATIRVANEAFDAITLEVPWVHIGTTLAVVLLGGTLMGAMSGLSLRRRQGRRGTGGAPRFPGPVRFLFVTPRISAGVFAAVFVTSSILTVLAGATSVPAELFGGTEDTVLTTGDANPLRGQADRFIGEHPELVPGIEAGFAETIVPTTIDGQAVLLKGVRFDQWRAWNEPELMLGHWPENPSEATAGARLMRDVGLRLGATYAVPAAYAPGYASITIVGVHDSQSFDGDEIFTDLDTAGALAGLPPDRVTLVRLQLNDPNLPLDLVTIPLGVHVVNISVFPENPIPFGTGFVRIQLANFGHEHAARSLQVRINGNLTETRTVEMAPVSREELRIPVLFPGDARIRVEVNPTEEADAGQADFIVQVPDVARPGEPFQVTVTDLDGAPAEALLLLEGAIWAGTEGDGKTTASIADPGVWTVTARSGARQGGAQVRVADAAYDNQSFLVTQLVQLDEPEPASDDTARVTGRARIANAGGATHVRGLDGNVTIRSGAEVLHTLALPPSLESRARATIGFQVELSTGIHTLDIGGHEVVVVIGPEHTASAAPTPAPTTPVQPTQPQAPTSIEEVLSRKESERAKGNTRGDPAQTFMDELFGGVGAATGIVLLATLALAGILTWVTVAREAKERASNLQVARGIGMNATQVAQRAARDALIAALPSTLIAVAMVWLGLGLAYDATLPSAFGHAVPTQDAWLVGLRVGGAVLAIAIIAAQATARPTTRRGVRAAPRQADPDHPTRGSSEVA